MTTLQEKTEARRQAWIRAEALKIASAIEAQQIVDMVTPNIQDKMRTWIHMEVKNMMKTVAAEVLQDVKEHVKGEVANYCRSVFDSQSMDDDHFHMVKEAEPEPDLYTPPADESDYEDEKGLDDMNLLKLNSDSAQ
jgi:hypothetical protein